MLKYQWTSIDIKTEKDMYDMVDLFQRIKPKLGGFDTESSGLHIILDKPFLVQFGFLHPTEPYGFTYAIDLELHKDIAYRTLGLWLELAKSLRYYVGHNVKFDVHMLRNIGYVYNTENLTDTMFFIRYGHDALHTEEGGPPLGLKDYSVRYIDVKAKYHEKLLAVERSQIAKDLNMKLKIRLNRLGQPDPKYNAKSYTLSVIKKMFDDPTFEVADLPENVRAEYINWFTLDLPPYLQEKVTALVESDMIRYNTLNRTNLTKYAHYDVIYTLEILSALIPVVKARHNEWAIQLENSLILPLVEMERVGFETDVNYLEESRKRVKVYLRQRRKLFYELAGCELGLGQHAKVKEILHDKYHVQVGSTNSDELNLLKSNLIRQNENPEAVEFIGILQELRTLEKWYAAYILRFQKDLKHTTRLYTTIHQVGTVSGRVTSDFQQFPKKAIKTFNGIELFHPRRIVKISGGHKQGIVYLDYSQIELRFQALYTILVGDADLNLCRAYMPYKCVNPSGKLFDYNNPEDIRNWNKEWYYEEEPTKHWTPTDVHGATTEKATGLTPNHPDFHSLRSTIGKRTNFAKNYGAQLKKIMEMFPDKTRDECVRIDGAYYAAFPGVKSYHSYCYDRANYFGYTQNLFGVRYYNVSGHKLINMLVQGSAAFYLKWKIRQLYEYSKAHNLHTIWQMQIHDELSWEYDDRDDPAIFFEFKRIMEDWEDGLVPVVADMEATTETWADKIEIETLEELKEKFNEVQTCSVA